MKKTYIYYTINIKMDEKKHFKWLKLAAVQRPLTAIECQSVTMRTSCYSRKKEEALS